MSEKVIILYDSQYKRALEAALDKTLNEKVTASTY